MNSFNLEGGELRSNDSVQLGQNGRVTQATNFQGTYPGKVDILTKGEQTSHDLNPRKVGVLTKGEQTSHDLTLPNLTV